MDLRPRPPFLLIVVVSLLGGCAPSPSVTDRPASQAPATSGPTLSEAPPTESPSVAPTQESTLTWVQIGEIPDGGGELLDWWFSAGFLVMGSVEVDGSFAPVIWYSPDGRDWERTDLSSMVTPCPGWTPRPDAWVQDGWAAGGGAVLVGMEYDLDAVVCGSMRPVAWSSGDGRNWTKTHDFRTQGVAISYPINVWATPTGWEAAIKDVDDRTWLWQSSNAGVWDRVALITGPGISSVTVASDGTRLLLEADDDGSARRLRVSADGREWRRIDGPPIVAAGPNDYWQISRVLYPDQFVPEPFWMVVTTHGEQVPATTWASTDLVTWREHPFPMPAIQTMRHTSEGIIALGIDPCTDTGGECPPQEPSQYFVSRDGGSWERLAAAVGPTSFVEGDTGVILGVGAPSVDGGAAPVYRLDRYSDAEASLLAGMRDDAGFGCSPRRSDLPVGATAGVECAPGVAEVDRVGIYQFGSEATLLATYFDRLAAAGVEPGSGDCPAGPGDAAYRGEDTGGTFDAHRIGCYLNEFDNANYRITFPESLVYVGVLGTGSDLGTLGDWIWQGDESVPPSPTIWQAGS